jgi:hypothetical protein
MMIINDDLPIQFLQAELKFSQWRIIGLSIALVIIRGGLLIWSDSGSTRNKPSFVSMNNKPSKSGLLVLPPASVILNTLNIGHFSSLDVIG